MKNEYIRLEEVTTLIMGQAPNSNDCNYNGDGMPFVKAGEFTERDPIIREWTTNSLKIAQKDDVLICVVGATAGKVNLGINAAIGRSVAAIRCSKDKLNYLYLYYFLKTWLIKIRDKSQGSAIGVITKDMINDINIPLPSLDKQSVVVEILEKAQELIDIRKAQIEALDELVKSRFIEMFGDAVKNTMEWNMEPLSGIGIIGRGVSKHRPRNAPELLGGKYPLIQTGDVANAELYIKDYNATYSEFGLKQSKLWKKGTLCITIAANIAKTGILTFDACFPDSVVGFIAGEKTNNIFMYYWFSAFQKLLEEQAPESAQKNINLKILSDLKVIVPPIDLQNQFAAFVNQVDKLKFEMQKSLQELEDNFQSLMQRAFKGELFK